MTTTTADILAFLDSELINPVLADGHAVDRRRVRFARMCLRRLPAKSAALYCVHGAESRTPNRLATNLSLEENGFRSFRDLLPTMARTFADVWPRK